MTTPTETWADRIREAQGLTHALIEGQVFERVPYGRERPDPLPTCRDCAVAIGGLHVPLCCVERCPRCDGQALSCPCPDIEAFRRTQWDA